MTLRGKTVVLLKLGLIAFATALISLNFLSSSVSAAQITNRSLTLETGATGDGGSKPGGNVKHFFQFTLASSTTVGSIKFQYCTTASGSCTAPGVAGGGGNVIDTTSATLANESGATGFSIVNATNAAPYLTRSTSAASGAVSYRLAGIINPKDPANPNLAFYVRVTTYASTDTTGGVTDSGVMAASTAQQITLTGTMPESLIFCTGGTITLTSGIPDCSTASSGSISFNQLFSPADTATATNQMAASTNADNGYSITYAGPTLTSGSNTVTAMSSATTGVRGTRQFGLNLVANTTTTSTPAVGANVNPASNAGTLKGKVTAGYNTPDTFKFTTSGDTVAQSNDGGTSGPTDVQLYTVSYMANVSGGQPIGTYTTTLTYVCTATF
jgi:hypothetical protein